MAGGKETPRQKLVGLMYLVFLCLLALKVSSSILQKFESMYYSLDNSANETQHRSKMMMEAMAEAAKKGTSTDKKIYKEAEKVRKKTADLLEFVKNAELELAEKTGNKTEDGDISVIENPSNSETVAQMMVGPGNKKNGKGYQLQDKLNEHVKYFNSTLDYLGKKNPDISVGDKLRLIAKDPTDMSKRELANAHLHGDDKKKDFAKLNFDQTPMVAAIAAMAEKRAKIAQYEQQVLEKFSAALKVNPVQITGLEASYKARSEVVAAGTEYEARMFLMPKLKTSATFYRGGRKLKTEEGMGIIKFKASAGKYDENGIAEKTWTGKIKAKKRGKDTTYIVKGKYKVAKPVCQVRSASISALYNNCVNDLQIDVPALGANYSPSFKVSGAQYEKGEKPGSVALIPNGVGKNRVKVDIINDGANVCGEKFNVRPIPKPTIELKKPNGSAVNMKQGENPAGLRRIRVEAVPDQHFKQTLPKEANYKVTGGKVLLVKGTRPHGSPVNISDGSVNLTSLARNAAKNDRYFVEVTEVMRRNSRGSVEKVKMGKPNPMFTIPLK